jgi:hypothetical protein
MTDRRGPPDFQPADADGSFDPGDHDVVRVLVTSRSAYRGTAVVVHIEQVCGDVGGVWTKRDVRELPVGVTEFAVDIERHRTLRSWSEGCDPRELETLWSRGEPPTR